MASSMSSSSLMDVLHFPTFLGDVVRVNDECYVFNKLLIKKRNVRNFEGIVSGFVDCGECFNWSSSSSHSSSSSLSSSSSDSSSSSNSSISSSSSSSLSSSSSSSISSISSSSVSSSSISSSVSSSSSS